jgi:hypothetical protein
VKTRGSPRRPRNPTSVTDGTVPASSGAGVGGLTKLLAVLGGVVFAVGGAAMGAMNAGWFGLTRDLNAVFPLLGASLLLVEWGWARWGWARKLWGSGLLGRTTAALLTVGALFFLLNPVLQFAILGTLSFGIGLVLFAALLWRQRLMATLDRVAATLAAVASLTWNTETLSAFLLVTVGLLLAVLSARMEPVDGR